MPCDCSIFGNMKNFLFTVIPFACAFLALYEQSKPTPNKYIMVGGIVVFMLGIMRLMSKVPSKHNRDEDTEV